MSAFYSMRLESRLTAFLPHPGHSQNSIENGKLSFRSTHQILALAALQIDCSPVKVTEGSTDPHGFIIPATLFRRAFVSLLNRKDVDWIWQNRCNSRLRGWRGLLERSAEFRSVLRLGRCNHKQPDDDYCCHVYAPAGCLHGRHEPILNQTQIA